MPSNGLWDGPGILSDSGLFDPGFSNGADSLAKITYTANGCVDTADVLVAYTRVTQDTLTFCGYDALYDLTFDNTIGSLDLEACGVVPAYSKIAKMACLTYRH